MNLGTLYEMYGNGALNIDVSEDGTSGTIGGMAVSKEQTEKLCEIIGWKRYELSPFKMIDKTKKFMSALNRAGLFKKLDNDILNRTSITFENKPDTDYKKYFDRIVLGFPKKSLTVIYNMKNAGAAYVIYETDGNSVPISKNRNLKGVADYIISHI